MRSLALALGAAVLGAAALAGCGSVAAGQATTSGDSGTPAVAGGSSASGTAATKPALCAGVNAVSQLVVLRNRSFSQIQELHFGFPAVVTVTNAADARAVARAVCALPRMPRGVMPCPVLLTGTTYGLSFTAAGHRLALVTAQATGCQSVTGAGPARRAATSAGFWRTLGVAMRLSAPGPSVFAGFGPSAVRCQSAAKRLAVIGGCPIQPTGFKKAG